MLIEPSRSYDIIGDLHGCADSLVELLQLLGYRRKAGVWQHSSRQALFLGDIIDRGAQIRETLEIVYRMVEAGHAHCIMGNHEYYALAWHMSAPNETEQLFVRDHNQRHARLWQETAEEFAQHPQEWHDYLDWFAQLPLYLDGERFRLVHAYWDNRLIKQVEQLFAGGRVTREFIQQSAIKDSFAYQVFNRLLRGINLPLPDGVTVQGSDGLLRRTFRAKFWPETQTAKTYADFAFQPDPIPEQIALKPLPKDLLQQVEQHSNEQPILFVGHYWCKGQPGYIQPNLACLDYSAVNSGKLVAYRLDQETQLDASKFVWVKGGL